jgi:chromate reductase
MPEAARSIRLVGLGGSLRRESYSMAVLRTLKDKCAAKAEVRIHPLDAVPLYNGDLDGDHPPEAVRALKQAVTESDGLLVCTPEYNYGTSGVLKNALDWASRPGYESPLKGKPALIVSTSPGAIGGARAHLQVRETLSAALARVVARPQVTIGQVHQKVKDGVLVDASTIEFSLAAIDELIAEIELLRRR